jgi:hypothetical protein
MDEGVMRDRRSLYWTLVALSAATLILVVVNIFLARDVRSVQAEVNQRQQFINQSIRLSQVNSVLIRALAQAAINDKDDKLRALLAENGITVAASGSTTTPAPGAEPKSPTTPTPAQAPTAPAK